MIKMDRGGQTLKTGKIGRMNVLRQNILLPGETVNARLTGSVRLESLRERDSLRINAQLVTFMTPLRWLWTNFPTYLREGPTTLETMPTVTVGDLAKYGVGSKAGTSTMPTHFRNSVLRIYNEWFKWPEDADITGDIDTDGPVCVPLQKAWNRCRYDASPGDTADYMVSTATGDEFDVRDLAEMQARFKGAMKRDVLSYNRYMEVVREMFGGDPSREVDQVPMMIDQTEVGVNPREIPATDGASLGQWQSLFDFDVDHSIPGITAPEHCVLTYVLVIRFSAVTETRMPLCGPNLNWFEVVGDPDWIASAEPQPVTAADVFLDDTDATAFGYLPAGWQWRCDHDVVGARIDQRDSFPMMNTPTTQAQTKDATRIKNAFRSSSLGDYVVDVFFKEPSRLPISDALESYYSGLGGKNSGAEFPKQGKMV